MNQRRVGRPSALKMEDIKTPRGWDNIPQEMKGFFVEFECFLVMRQLFELNIKPQQVVDLLTVSLMSHDKDAAYKFRDQLIITNQKYIHKELFNVTLCKYLFVAGVGVNKIMRMVKMAQTTVYNVAYGMVEEIEEGRYKNHYTQFMSEIFIENLDNLMNTLRTIDEMRLRVPRPNNARGGAKSAIEKQVEVIRNNLRKQRTWV